MAISDVELKNNYYRVLDEDNKKISEKPASLVGELQGFNSEYMVFYKNHYFTVYNETFGKIKEKPESELGEFRNTGSTINFKKNNYIISYDKRFSKLSQRHVWFFNYKA